MSADLRSEGWEAAPSRRYWLGLDDYELANLKAALLAGSRWQAGPCPLDVLNSGDWIGQLTYRLPDVDLRPNVTVEEYRERARKQSAADVLTMLASYFTLRSEHPSVEQFIDWYCGERHIPRPVTP